MLAEEATPSRELIEASLEDAAYTFTAVSARNISTIPDTVLEGRGCVEWDFAALPTKEAIQ